MSLEIVSDSEALNTQSPSVGEAKVCIEGMRWEILLRGACDSENDLINRILSQLDQDKTTPKEAVATVASILYDKQDYH